jgi:hypothetical protein
VTDRFTRAVAAAASVLEVAAESVAAAADVVSLEEAPMLLRQRSGNQPL